MLVARVVEDARARAATRIHLEVEPDNAAALTLYESFGFSDSRVRRNYYATASTH